jgi:uncharacterized protein
MPLRQSDLIEIRKIRGKGRGVFAREAIPAETVIERVPMLIFSATVLEAELADYAFEWAPGKVGLAMGYGSIYNHSFKPNAYYTDDGPQIKSYIALKDIEAGEEITINYNADPDDQSPVDFNVLD